MWGDASKIKMNPGMPKKPLTEESSLVWPSQTIRRFMIFDGEWKEIDKISKIVEQRKKEAENGG